MGSTHDDSKTEAANDTVLCTVNETAASEYVDQSKEIMILSVSDAETKPAAQNAGTKANRNVFRQKLVSAQRVFRDRLSKCFHGDRTTRLYHVWPGNNVFLFGGRLVCGPDPRGLGLTTMAILMSSWSFAAYVADGSAPKIIFSVIFTLIVLFNFGMVSTSDPGIIPQSNDTLVDNYMGRRVEVEGIEVRLKYCRICNIYRPLRSRHCTICDNCVEKYDHHCPWIGQCIGLRNYRLYIVFLLMALVFFAYIFASSFQKIQHVLAQNDGVLMELLHNCPETLALTSFTSVATLILGGLTCYNLYLVVVNQTAYENYHRCYASARNPYDRGVLSNLMEVLCWSTPT